LAGTLLRVLYMAHDEIHKGEVLGAWSNGH